MFLKGVILRSIIVREICYVDHVAEHENECQLESSIGLRQSVLMALASESTLGCPQVCNFSSSQSPCRYCRRGNSHNLVGRLGFNFWLWLPS